MLLRRVVVRVLHDPFPHRERQVQPAKLQMPILEMLHDAQRVQIVIEAQPMPLERLIEGPFPGMPKRRMPDVMRQRQRLGQVLVQAQRPRDGARNLRHFHSVGQPAAEMIRPAVREHLRLRPQAAERRANE